MEGIVLFNKPSGYYSNQILNYFRKIFKEKKIGHGGTLDKLAQGLLIIGIGEETKYLNYFLKKTKKTYLAEIKFGYISETYDREGKLKKINNCQINKENLINILEKFKGEINQQPPKYSAVKIKGQPAYKLARQQIEFDLPIKKVTLYDYQIISFYEETLKIRLVVSSGFYVRSFANDLGKELSCGAVLWNLIREKIGNFKLNKALSFEDFEKNYLECKIYVYGKVQRVGYRYFCLNLAKKFNVFGYAENLSDGRVKVLIQGELEKLNEILQKLKIGPYLAKVDKVIAIWQKPLNSYRSFNIF